MKKSSITQSFLSRFDAAIRLQVLYLRFLKANGINDSERPDWYSILVENGRDPLSLSAIKKGCPRGNRGAYTRLNLIRIASKPFYIKDDLDKWFMDHFESRILSRAI